MIWDALYETVSRVRVVIKMQIKNNEKKLESDRFIHKIQFLWDI